MDYSMDSGYGAGYRNTMHVHGQTQQYLDPSMDSVEFADMQNFRGGGPQGQYYQAGGARGQGVMPRGAYDSYTSESGSDFSPQQPPPRRQYTNAAGGTYYQSPTAGVVMHGGLGGVSESAEISYTDDDDFFDDDTTSVGGDARSTHPGTRHGPGHGHGHGHPGAVGRSGSGDLGSSDQGLVVKRRPPGARAAATMRGRLEQAVEEAMSRHVATWDVRDVCNWIEVVGLGQYRRKFAHNSIDGGMLLKLTDEHMRRDLGILPLGTRQALKGMIEELKSMAEKMGTDASVGHNNQGPAAAGVVEHPRKPASAGPDVIPPDPALGPAQGRITVAEQRSKIRYQLDRTANKAAQHRAIIEEVQRRKDVTEDEVRRLHGQLVALDAEHQKAAKAAGGPQADVPWRPNNQFVPEQHPERFAKPGDDPRLDMTFKPKISEFAKKKKDHLPIFQRMENLIDKQQKLIDEIKEAEEEEEQRRAMEVLQGGGDAGEPVPGARSAKDGGFSYWVPGGAGFNHKKPEHKKPKLKWDKYRKARRLDPGEPDAEARRLSNDITFLERMFKKFNYREDVSDPDYDDARRPKVPYKELLEALDDIIDAILEPLDTMNTFQKAVKDFLKRSNMDVDSKEGVVFTDPLIRKLKHLKGCETISEMDQKRIRLKNIHRREDRDLDPVAEEEKRRKEMKIKGVAGLLHMAKLVERSYKPTKADDPDNEGLNKIDEARRRAGRAPLPPWTSQDAGWVPNGTLLHKDGGDKAGKRIQTWKQKLGVTEGPKPANNKIAALEKDAERAREFFSLLGWHRAQPQDDPGRLVNALLRRALYAANLRDRQVKLVKSSKAVKTELLRELNLELSRMSLSDPRAKTLSAKISRVKAQPIDSEELPPIDWTAAQFRDDGLKPLQEEELAERRGMLAEQWELERGRCEAALLKRMQRAQLLEEVAEVDWEVEAQPGWDVDEAVQELDYLTYCTELLSQLPSTELRKMLRMPPSGLQGNGGQQSDRGESTAVPALRQYGAGRDEEKPVAAPDARRQLMKKEVAVHKALLTMRFVQETKAKQAEKEERLAAQYESLRVGKSRKVSAQRQNEFFDRLLNDIERRRDDMERRANAQLEAEMSELKHFKAGPVSASLAIAARQRSRSPSPAPSYRQGPSQQGSGYFSSGGSSGASTPRKARTGGGFYYWYQSGRSTAAPSTAPRTPPNEREGPRSSAPGRGRSTGGGAGGRPGSAPPKSIQQRGPNPGSRPQSARPVGTAGGRGGGRGGGPGASAGGGGGAASGRVAGATGQGRAQRRGLLHTDDSEASSSSAAVTPRQQQQSYDDSRSSSPLPGPSGASSRSPSPLGRGRASEAGPPSSS